MQKTPSHDTLRDRLSRYNELRITVTGRKSGRDITNPVWFVAEGDTLYVLPVHGSDTQWYKNVLKHPQVKIDARGEGTALKVTPLTEPNGVSAVVEKFRAKYGPGDVKKYYSKFDVAVRAHLH